MVYRIYVEKKSEYSHNAASLLEDLRGISGTEGLEGIRIINRYDADLIDEETFEGAVDTVFSEPQVDNVYRELDTAGADRVFATEYLPGQFDMRADSAQQCIQLISQKERPIIRCATVYLLYGQISDETFDAIVSYMINPVDSRRASLEKPESLEADYPEPDPVETMEGFSLMSDDELSSLIGSMGLAMDLDDLKMCRDYFDSEKRDPTITEIKLIDTYWSDHCRHTTFSTVIDRVAFGEQVHRDTFEEYLRIRKEVGSKKPVCLMDMATIATKYLKYKGVLTKLDESEEINACSIKAQIEVDGKSEPWLLMFKNETHNHPTEIEPFGGAATCIGGAIRDPLSGRAYIYGAMRLTGAADPTVSVSETLPGKLPQKKLVTEAARGYSSYGNQIGIATGIVNEIYHPGYVAKHMETGAVIAAVPEANVVRKRPEPGDTVILLGGRTGRDGIGGATGSSKAHTSRSVETCAAEVQKGNAPEERKLQRLFRDPRASLMIKRCNDFGAGGVSVAIGELADGLFIDLDRVPVKYEGLDGTEIAISESQERMAVVVNSEDTRKFLALARAENLEATPVAVVTDNERLIMRYRGQRLVDIARSFLDTNGAPKHRSAVTSKAVQAGDEPDGTFCELIRKRAGDLSVCSRKALSDRFDSTIGAGTVLMPYGGKYQLTPIQAMAHLFPVGASHTQDCSLMSWGYDPYITERSPYIGSYLAVVDSVCRLIATGAEFRDIYLSFQEYFEKPTDNVSFGKPMEALLGALKAQLDLQVAAIGGKDSMSGSFEDLHVPPALISFAVCAEKAEHIVSPELKQKGNKLILIEAEKDENGLPVASSLKQVISDVTSLLRSGLAVSCRTPGSEGIAVSIMEMGFGNMKGAEISGISKEKLFEPAYGSFIVECTPGLRDDDAIGTVTDDGILTFEGERISLRELCGISEEKLSGVYGSSASFDDTPDNVSFQRAIPYPAPAVRTEKPRILIPVFPGTNCEYDSMRAVEDGGCAAEVFVINNMTSDDVSMSARQFAEKIRGSQAIFIPGGFSGGDEPDGSAKFITAFFRNPLIRDAVTDRLDERGGLMLGICNGFQALIKLGLVPYGRIVDPESDSPTLTFNTVGRHHSGIVRTRIASDLSPWFGRVRTGETYCVPVSHGEGRFIASEELLERLARNGQIATQYADLDGNAACDITYNPNGSVWSIEGITSPDGRVLGKMGHAERIGTGLYKNVEGKYHLHLFESAADFFRKN
ncbi:MAG: phosphoribosylformylglycinamidine synthase [Eubacteriaceae bacterium]|nr:phosphoribosylformylglycinamidine synthase [Eubacteriaceae bacterium]